MEYHQSLMYLGGVVAAFIMLSFIVVWVIGLAMKDSSIVDIWFSPCLGIAAVIGWQIGGGAEDRSLLVMVLALLWSLRLGGYLLWRNWGKEDRRYARLRQHVESQGKSYALHSLIHVNIYQGITVVILAVPFVFAQVSAAPAALGVLAWLGSALVLSGVVFEGVADLQLTRFKADAANAGKVLDYTTKKFTVVQLPIELVVWFTVYFIRSISNTTALTINILFVLICCLRLCQLSCV